MKLSNVFAAVVSAWAVRVQASSPILLSASPPAGAALPVLESFISFSIEFSSFPDFAGNSSHPNKFSYNLISNLGKLQGSNPIIRIGGNTQDYALFNASQSSAIIGTYDPARSPDYPTTITVGPSYFDSYSTWPNVSFTHGFNLASNSSLGHSTLVQTAKLACKALSAGGKLAYWELGNEPDLYVSSHQGPVRPLGWDEQDYVSEWIVKTRILKEVMMDACPKEVNAGKFKFIAPSFAETTNNLSPVTTWQSGLNGDGDIALISGHNYISGATSPGVTLQGTLMNHTSTASSISYQLSNWAPVLALSTSSTPNHTPLPFIFGEANSLYNEGAPGLSDSFGAALWVLDFALYCAANNVSRWHAHQGTNYRYAAWQPVTTEKEMVGTKAPYYGSVAAASFLSLTGALGHTTVSGVQVAELAIDSDADPVYNAAYASYVNGQLARIAVIQMNEYNSSTSTFTQADGSIGSGTRPSQSFTFQIPGARYASGNQKVKVQILLANGSDAVTGVTFGGVSYDYALGRGKPVVVKSVTDGVQMVQVGSGGMLQIEVPFSSAAIVELL